MSIEAHSGKVELAHSFEQACAWLEKRGSRQLETSRGTPFGAEVSIVIRGRHLGNPVIVFRNQQGQEYARAYSCCWGAYYNCNRTRIGMYCAALDEAMAESE